MVCLYRAPQESTCPRLCHLWILRRSGGDGASSRRRGLVRLDVRRICIRGYCRLDDSRAPTRTHCHRDRAVRGGRLSALRRSRLSVVVGPHCHHDVSCARGSGSTATPVPAQSVARAPPLSRAARLSVEMIEMQRSGGGVDETSGADRAAGRASELHGGGGAFARAGRRRCAGSLGQYAGDESRPTLIAQEKRSGDLRGAGRPSRRHGVVAKERSPPSRCNGSGGQIALDQRRGLSTVEGLSADQGRGVAMDREISAHP